MLPRVASAAAPFVADTADTAEEEGGGKSASFPNAASSRFMVGASARRMPPPSTSAAGLPKTPSARRKSLASMPEA